MCSLFFIKLMMALSTICGCLLLHLVAIYREFTQLKLLCRVELFKSATDYRPFLKKLTN